MVNSFFDYVKEKGYIFEEDFIVNYLLSLKVKPFVIFCGNSGTGKTKLAQLFAEYCSSFSKKYLDLSSGKKVGKCYDSQEIGLNKEILLKYYPFNLTPDSEDFNFCVNGHEGSGKLRVQFKIKNFGKEGNDVADYLKNCDSNEDLNVNLLFNTFDEHYKIIPVGANWVDNSNILGYYDINGHHQETPSYELISSANVNFINPYFLILDEMNLSNVERYFADFLSAIESGKPIPLDKNNNLSIPKNLFVIGTVNIDETTYMFSPKVLDRANVIEFNTIPPKEYIDSLVKNKDIHCDENNAENNNDNERSDDILFLENPLMSCKNMGECIKDLQNISIKGEESFLIKLSEDLDHVYAVLEKIGFDFGFRTNNEILMFMCVAYKYDLLRKDKNENLFEDDMWLNWKHYLDVQIKQKILPKIHGSEREIGEKLHDLRKFCKDNSYDSSCKKLDSMIDTLEKQKYVSFIN